VLVQNRSKQSELYKTLSSVPQPNRIEGHLDEQAKHHDRSMMIRHPKDSNVDGLRLETAMLRCCVVSNARPLELEQLA